MKAIEELEKCKSIKLMRPETVFNIFLLGLKSDPPCRDDNARFTTVQN